MAHQTSQEDMEGVGADDKPATAHQSRGAQTINASGRSKVKGSTMTGPVTNTIIHNHPAEASTSQSQGRKRKAAVSSDGKKRVKMGTEVSSHFEYDEESKALFVRPVKTIHVGNVDTFHVGDIHHHHHVSESVQDQEKCDESSYREMEVKANIEPINELVTTGDDEAGAIEADPRILKRLQKVFANCHNFEEWRENRKLCLEAASLFEHQGRASLTQVRFDSVHFFVRVKLGPDHDAFLQAYTDGTLSRGLTKILVTPELKEAAGVKLRLRLDVKETSNTSNVSAPAEPGTVHHRGGAQTCIVSGSSKVEGRTMTESMTTGTI